MFTSATRAAIEKIQQQYGLPVNGVWGSLERQVFDNARVRTLPPSSAASLMPPDYNRTTNAVKYQKAVVSQRPAPAASKLSKTSPSAAIPTDVSGIVTCAAAGFLTAAVLTKADAARRARLPPAAAPRASPRATVADAATQLWGKIVGGFSVGGASYPSRDHHHVSGRGWYDEQGYFHQEPPRGPPSDFRVPDKRAQQQREFGGATADWDGRWWDATRADSHDPFPGGYPIPPSGGIDAGGGYGAFAARGPVRPGDRRAAERAHERDAAAAAAAAAEANAPRGYHPAFAPGGPAHDPDRMPSPPPPPSTPPPPGAQRGRPGSSRQNRGGFGDVDVMGLDRDGVVSFEEIRDARDNGAPGPLGGGGAPRGVGTQGRGGSHAGGRPASRTTASVPPYGDWGGSGGGAFDTRVRAGPAAVPEFGGADAMRGLSGVGPNHPNLVQGRGLAAAGGPMAAAATAAAANKAATATLAPPKPMPPSERRRLEAAAKQKGLFQSLGDGLRNLANAPNAFNGAAQAREQSEFTARAQRERELLAQVAEAQEYARLEQKKRQQLEAAYQSTRNALKEAQTAREGLKAQESLSAEMKSKMTALEKALNERDVAAASGVFGGDSAQMTALTDRVRALETALATASAKSNGPGDAAAVAALTHLQEKVRMLEHAFSERNATADAAAAAVTKVDQLAAQVQKDAAAVPELQKQMAELRETIARTPGAAAAGGTMAVEANLKEMTERMQKLEASLAKVRENPMSLDVLYAKVGAVEEGLAATANGSSNLIQELQQKMQKLEGAATAAPGVGVPVQAPGMNNVVKAFPPPPAPAAPAPATPKREPKPPPGFNPPVPPKPAAPKPAKLPPAFTPSIEIKDGAAAPGPATPPGWGDKATTAATQAPAPAQPQVDTKKLGDDYKVEEGTLPRIATGREVMLQGFNWESHKFDWYTLVGERASEIADVGFTQIWLPPCTDSLAPEGYLPRNLRSLNSKYGDEAGLRKLIGTLREKNILPVLDAVLNHRCATHQGAGGKWNTWKDCGGMDWGEWAITNRNPDFAGQGGDPTGDEFHGAPNIDHRNERVQQSLCEWIQWLTTDVGFGGIRFDFSKGYGGEFAGIYIRACMPEFSVGEYWDTLNYGQGLEYDQDAHRQRIVDWIDSTGGLSTAFDFTTKGILQEACGRNEFWRLVDKKGRAPGVIGLWPGRAVTFIDNHDTGSTQSHWPFPSNKVGMGYAYILTHPGTPSVFWDHYFDWGDDLKNQIKGLLRARDDAGIHSRSKLEIVAATDQVYAALVGDRLAVKLGHDGWSPSGEGWQQAVSGDAWCVWTKPQ